MPGGDDFRDAIEQPQGLAGVGVGVGGAHVGIEGRRLRHGRA
jgi:hypothetical protein